MSRWNSCLLVVITDYKVRSMLHGDTWSVIGGCDGERKHGGNHRTRKNEMKSK